MQKTLTEQSLEEHDKAKILLAKLKEKEKELKGELVKIRYKRDGVTMVAETKDPEYNKKIMKKIGWQVTK